jgi:hypothetical protein
MAPRGPRPSRLSTARIWIGEVAPTVSASSTNRIWLNTADPTPALYFLDGVGEWVPMIAAEDPIPET